MSDLCDKNNAFSGDQRISHKQRDSESCLTPCPQSRNIIDIKGLRVQTEIKKKIKGNREQII